MQLKQYQARQLGSLLESLFANNSSGILTLKTKVTSGKNQRSCVLILHNGALVYGGSKLMNNQEFAKMLGDKLKPNLINAALTVAREKLTNSTSVRKLVEFLTRIRVFKWEEVEAFIQTNIILILEKFLSYPGEAQWEANKEFDLSYGEDGHGLDWSKLKQELNRRQQQWNSLTPAIPSMDAIPIVREEYFKKITDRKIKEHLENFVDGHNSLIEIAEKIEKDPLLMAKTYLNWVNLDLLSFNNHEIKNPVVARETVSDSQGKSANVEQPEKVKDLPMILSVDDSPIIQVSIKRALSDRYNVLLADKATEALKILNQQPIKLVLLDLTMPDIDGLEFCKTIRRIPRFRDLPIIMVTARDGLVDKMKGHIAGTNKYLTKPFKPEELQEIVDKYIND